VSNGRITLKSEKLRKKAVVPYWNLETGDRETRKFSFGTDELSGGFSQLAIARAFGGSDNYRIGGRMSCLLRRQYEYRPKLKEFGTSSLKTK